MTDFQRACFADNAATRRRIYEGQLFLLPARDESRMLAAAVWQEIERELAEGCPAREAQFHLADDEFFQRVGRLRRRFYTSIEFHELAAAVIAGYGLNPTEHAFDPIRLRVVTHAGHLNAAARPVYYGHRDTWYANPQSMITWWIPLHEVGPAETFEFFPDAFRAVTRNDSEIFDFNTWVADGQNQRIGWQDKNTGRTAGYPRLLEQPPGRRVPVACGPADVLLFSAQHLHQTRPNMTGQTRFSLDFRTVHLEDHRLGIEPVNVDNRSTGCSLVQFVKPGTWQQPLGSPMPNKLQTRTTSESQSERPK